MAETYPSPRFGAPRESKSPANPGSGLVRMLDIVTTSHARAVGFLVLCALLLFLPGFFTIPPIDRDEARFAQATKQMVESGDYVDIRFQEDVRYKKPVGIYWLQSATVEAASLLKLPRAELRIWVYRLPSLMGAIGAVLMTYWAALGFVTRRAAVLAALMMCASVLLGVEARLAKTDAMLLFCVVAAMGAMARAYVSWLTTSVGGDMLSKLGAQESHGAPPGLYLVLFWITFWPGAPLAAMAAPAVWRARREPGAQFLLAWLIPSWIVFEAVLTKLPHYVLPLYPAIAILTAGAVEQRVLSRSWLARGSAWWFAIPAGASIIAVVGAVILTRQPAFVAWPFFAAALIFGLFAWWLYDNNRAERSFLNALVAALMLAVAVYGIVLPSLTPLFPSIEIARALRNVTCVGPKAAAAGYHEPSLVFLVGTRTLLTDGSGAADFLGQGSCRFALIEQRSERSFVQRAEAIGLRYKVGARIEGYNFSQGRAISISIFRSEGTE